MYVSQLAVGYIESHERGCGVIGVGCGVGRRAKVDGDVGIVEPQAVERVFTLGQHDARARCLQMTDEGIDTDGSNQTVGMESRLFQ